MQHRFKYFNHISSLSLVLAMISLFVSSCKKEEPYATPVPSDKLQDQAIKRTVGPNVVGQYIEFAYAMAILPTKGKLVSCVAEASVAGGPGTIMENRSFYTASNGSDVGITVGSAAVTNKTTTTVTFNKDTSASTLRYYYQIPEEARGKTVSIKFTCTSSNGETRSTTMGPYTVAKLDMTLNMKLSDGNAMYISIADSTVYTAAQAATKPDKIDLVYLYRTTPTTSLFNHALVAPAADAQYRPGITLPTGVNRDAKLLKTFNMQDHHLAPNLQYSTLFVDDLDFQQLDLTGYANFAINMKQEAGLWVETADKKYRAYIFFNAVATNGTATISMKRYPMQ